MVRQGIDPLVMARAGCHLGGEPTKKEIVQSAVGDIEAAQAGAVMRNRHQRVTGLTRVLAPIDCIHASPDSESIALVSFNR